MKSMSWVIGWFDLSSIIALTAAGCEPTIFRVSLNPLLFLSLCPLVTSWHFNSLNFFGRILINLKLERNDTFRPVSRTGVKTKMNEFSLKGNTKEKNYLIFAFNL